MIEAILFDMDGVLIDSEPVHAAATSDALEEFGLERIDRDVFDRYFFGKTDWSGFQDYLAAIGRGVVSLDRLLETKAARFAARFPLQVRPYQDGIATLRDAAAADLRVAVVSGSRQSEIDQALARFQLRPLVELTVSGDEVRDGKPNPAPYLLAAARLAVAPERCLVIEDAPAGVAAARAAGMRCVAVDRTGRPEALADADRTLRSLSLVAVLAPVPDRRAD